VDNAYFNTITSAVNNNDTSTATMTKSGPKKKAKATGKSTPKAKPKSSSPSSAPTSSKPKEKEKSILDDARIASAKEFIASQPKQLHTLLAETTLGLLSHTEHIQSKRTGTLRLQGPEAIIPKAINFKATLEIIDEFKDDQATIAHKQEFTEKLKEMQQSLSDIIVKHNHRTIILLSEKRQKLFITKMQEIAHILAIVHGGMNNLKLAEDTFSPVAAGAIHCYYSGLSDQNGLWKYLELKKEDVISLHKITNLTMANGTAKIDDVYLVPIAPFAYKICTPLLDNSSDDSKDNQSSNSEDTNPAENQNSGETDAEETEPDAPVIVPDPTIQSTIKSIVYSLGPLVQKVFINLLKSSTEYKLRKKVEAHADTFLKKKATLDLGQS
jgi:hypothetical protein